MNNIAYYNIMNVLLTCIEENKINDNFGPSHLSSVNRQLT